MAEEPKSDEQLIEAFRISNSEEAFRAIVAKYLGMIYGIARRKTQDHFVAEEISQNVFTALARKASGLRGTPTLAGWLYRCTAIECAAFHRRDRVRQKAMKTLANDDPLNPSEEPRWNEIQPVLDDAIAELAAGDRDLLLMRFFEGKRFSEIAVRKVAESWHRFSFGIPAVSACLGKAGWFGGHRTRPTNLVAI